MHCEIGDGGGTEQRLILGTEGWESPLPAKQADLQQADPADLESDLTLCRREHKSPPIHNPAPDNSFHLPH